MAMELKKNEIESILAEVKASLQSAKKTGAAKLSKAVGDDDSAEDTAPAAPEASDTAPAESAAPEAPAASPAAPAPDASAAPADPAMSAGPGDDAGAQDPAASAGPTDPMALQAEYEKLTDDELRTHYMACKQAVFGRMQGAQSAGPDASADPAAAGAPPADPAMSAGPDASAQTSAPTMKGEDKVETASQGKMGKQNLNGPAAAEGGAKKIGKQDLNGPSTAEDGSSSPVSEKQAAASPTGDMQKSERETDMEAQIAGLTKAVGLLINQPGNLRKAVTSVAVLERTQTLEKSEAKKPDLAPEDLKSKLSELIRSGKLSKAEKEGVLSFYETKNPVHLKKLAHLFE